MIHTIALFGEAEKGEFHTAYFCKTVPQLFETFGHPPEESNGLECAINFLMYRHQVVY